jgi:2,5-diamino-6-(ribosylamino)-4(3H)-pyrimidinone 5'-phosphate reductase
MASAFWDIPPATHALVARHLPVQEEPHPLPRPIILDTNLRLSTTCKLLQNYHERRGRRPWVVCSDVHSLTKSHRKQELENAGAKIIEVAQGQDGMYPSISPA